MFILGGASEQLRLKSYSASTRGTRSTITIVMETDDHQEFAYALRCLAGVEAEQKEQAAAVRRAAAEAKTRTRSQAQKRLALPPPPRALPKPGDVS